MFTWILIWLRKMVSKLLLLPFNRVDTQPLNSDLFYSWTLFVSMGSAYMADIQAAHNSILSQLAFFVRLGEI